MTRVLAIAGTRPEVIKLAPLERAFDRLNGNARFDLVAVAQQRRILDQALEEWRLSPAVRLAYGRSNGSPTPELLADLERSIRRLRPDWVVVQGDTTTALAGALAADRAGVRCAHVEAGLRTGDLADPYPEELNRILISQVCQRHYAPTENARRNLIDEGHCPTTIRVVGNTGVDALMQSRRANGKAEPADRAPRRRRILVTGHRRENHGAGVERICAALKKIIALHPDVLVNFVLHPNPHAHGAPIARLSADPGIRLTSPLDHRNFVALLARAHVVLTDSGGVQEEAPYLGVPVLVTRDSTERPEVVSSGNALLVGNDVERVVAATSELLSNHAAYRRMARVTAPYGDGRAGRRIRDDLVRVSAWRSSTTR